MNNCIGYFFYFKILKYLKAREDGCSLGLFMKLYRVNVLQSPLENLLRGSLLGTDTLSVTVYSVHQEHET